MSAIKRGIHAAAIGITRRVAKLVPDRIPLLFVGEASTRELCGCAAQLGARRVLVVTDAGLVELGLAGRITRALEAAGAEPVVFAGVQPDPTFAQVEEGLVRLRDTGCDAVLALGGGSPMDAAKIIAAAATDGRSVEKLEGLFRLRRPPLPLFAVPTTAGTGSEVTMAAVLSETRSHAKKFFVDPRLLPRAAALDPTLMVGLPAAITAATGMDALTHAVESWLATTATPQTEGYARAAIGLIFEHLPTACERGEDLDARRGMALAACYAGLAFTRTSVGYVHAIAHTLGARYGTPHGLANALALPGVLEFSRPAATGRLAALAELVGIHSGGETERAEAFIEAVRGLEARIGIPRTLDALVASDIPGIAAQALTEAHMNYPVPRYMEPAACEALLRRLLATGRPQAAAPGDGASSPLASGA